MMIFSAQNNVETGDQDLNKNIEDVVDVSSYLEGYANIKPRDPVVYDKEETDLVEKVINEKLEKFFDERGYPTLKLKTIFQGQRCSTNEKLNLNYTIKMIRRQENIPVKDILIFFQLFAPIEKILSFIDADLILSAKKELAEEYGLKLSKSERTQCTNLLF